MLVFLREPRETFRRDVATTARYRFSSHNGTIACGLQAVKQSNSWAHLDLKTLCLAP